MSVDHSSTQNTPSRVIWQIEHSVSVLSFLVTKVVSLGKSVHQFISATTLRMVRDVVDFSMSK